MAEDINKLIENFKQSKTVKALDNYLSEMSMMEILGVDRDENAHSNFLAWLFGNEVTGKEACRLLLKSINKEVSSPILVKKVIREYFIQHDNQKGRIDIMIEYNEGETGKRIIIENKVLSTEHNKQTELYYKVFEKEAATTSFVFLTMSGAETECDKFKIISYQDLLDKVLIPLTTKISDIYTLLRIADYIKALGIRYSQDEVMAVDPYFKGLINQLWEENKELFKRFAEVNNQNRDGLTRFWNETYLGNVAMRDIIRPTFEALRFTQQAETENVYRAITKKGKDGKDRTKYSCKSKKNENNNKSSDNKTLSKNALFKWIVSKYISSYDKDKKHILTVEHLQQVFPASLHGKTCSASNRSQTDNNIILDHEKTDYDKIHEEPDIYICQTGWDGPAMMSRLIKYVKENIPELKDIEILEIPEFLQKK